MSDLLHSKQATNDILVQVMKTHRINSHLTYCMLALAAIVAGSLLAIFTLHHQNPRTSQARPQLPIPSLKSLASDRGLQIGSFASLKYLNEKSYSDILSSQFEYAIVDGEPNWRFEDFTLRPTPDTFDFNHLDQVMNFAEQNNMPVRIQHLVWGDEKWLPEWLTGQVHTEAELREIIKNHIDTVARRYIGKVREYSVVNEAFSRELKIGGNEDWWAKQLGRSYIDLAFLEAKKIDPHAVLILNDFGDETIGDVSNNMYDYVKDARSRGIPIEGIGMQMHIDGSNPPAKDKVVENMRRFADLGLKIYVTEFDVNMHEFKGSTKERENKQAEVYHDMLGACLEVGTNVCPNFGFLGLIDRQSWYNGIGIHDAYPLMFHDDYTPKPAFYAVHELLAKQ